MITNKKYWWHGPLRVIQTNLQVMDTAKMDPDKIARETVEMGGNVLVTNVGGIYAWYQSRVQYHHINEYLPNDRDLLGELIEACHRHGVKLVARFDFSKADDIAYQNHPEWFVREPDMSPRVFGAMRPGAWSNLYLTCINAGYRSHEVTVPVLEEVIDRYDIDGIFFNAPNYEYCCCETCRQKYRELYGRELPMDGSAVEKDTTYAIKQAAGLEPGFASRCVRDNMEVIYRAVKAKRVDLPLILYYNLYKDNLDDRYATADMICTESQDVLSRGWRDLPSLWHPVLSMKLGNTAQGRPAPFGIIHSCPGMDWRHTGLPTAEYLFWMSSVAAGGGSLWHSITGFKDTISDKRLLKAITEVDRHIASIEGDMDGASPRSDMLLLWDGSKSAEGWADILMNNQLQFDLAAPYQATRQRLAGYPLVIVPEGFTLENGLPEILVEYVEAGGRLIYEGASGGQLAPVAKLLGISEAISTSEPLTACYWRFEQNGDALRGDEFKETPLLPHRGQTAYCKPLPGTEVMATLVPPFAPLNSVGAPPERASMLVDRTELPLCLYRQAGSGAVMCLPFMLGGLMGQFRLAEHSRLGRNLVRFMLGGKETFSMKPVNGLEAVCYENGSSLLIHLLNGIGQRPLMDTVEYHGAKFRVRLPEGRRAERVELKLSGDTPLWKQEGDEVTVTVPKLSYWDMVKITLNEGRAGHGLVDGK